MLVALLKKLGLGLQFGGKMAAMANRQSSVCPHYHDEEVGLGFPKP